MESAIVQGFRVEKGYGFWAPNQYRSVFGYAFKARESRFAGFFTLGAEDEESAHMLQKKAVGATVTVRYNPENPDGSLIEEERISGRQITQNPHWLP
jgi:hypothetical protein